MKAAVLNQPHSIEIKEVSIPEPKCSLDNPFVNVEKVIINQYPLDDNQKAVEVAMTEKKKVLKL